MNKFESMINQRTRKCLKSIETLEKFFLCPHKKSYYQQRKICRKFYKDIWNEKERQKIKQKLNSIYGIQGGKNHD